MTDRFRCLVCCLALLGSWGCIASPQPSPPNLSPEGISRRSNHTDVMDGIVVFGQPGTVEPAEGVVVVTNLDQPFDPAVEPVLVDGGFMVLTEGLITDEYRIQVRSGGARTVPLDVVGNLDDATLAPAPRPLADCLQLMPAYELEFGEVRVGERVEETVVIRNECAQNVELLEPRFRESDTPFTAGNAGTIAPGEAREIVVAAVPTTPGSFEATLFVEATSPESDRRPLTLFVRGID